MKYPGINLTKEVKFLYFENYETVMKTIKGDAKKRKDVPCTWIKRIDIAKMLILSKAIYRFNAIFIKLLMSFFYRARMNNPKTYIEQKC